MGSNKRGLPSPVDNISLSLSSLRQESLEEQLIQNTSKKVKTNHSVTTTEKSKIKVIINEHNLEKPYSLEKLNNSVLNFKFLSFKTAYKNDKILICECLLDDLDKVYHKDNWNNIIQKLTIDKKSHLLDSICVNKIKKDKDTPPLPLYVIKSFLNQSVKPIFNLRYENNLAVFETLKDSISDFEIKITHNQTITSHSVRKFDPVDNYVIQCRKCHKYGHMKSDCNEKEDICAWCGKSNCGWKCDPTKKKCLNCQGKHSAQYKGCKSYKRAAEKASVIRTEKQHSRRISQLDQTNKELRNNYSSLKTEYSKSYAEAAILKSDSVKKTTEIENLTKLIKDCLTITTAVDKKITEMSAKMDLYEKRISDLETVTYNQSIEIANTKALLQNYVSVGTLPLVLFETLSCVLSQDKMTSIVENISTIFLKYFPDLIDQEEFVNRIQNNLLLETQTPSSPSLFPNLHSDAPPET